MLFIYLIMLIFERKNMRYFPSLVFLLVFFFSCQKETTKLLNQADALLVDDPSQALAILQTIEAQELFTDKGKARYALLMSAALDKNYIDIESDSLIRDAVDYYDTHNDRHSAMLAWYYEGLVLKNGQHYSSAIVALDRARKLAERNEDSFQLGLIYRNIASIHNRTNNNSEAIRNHSLSVHCFEQANASLYQAYVELDLAVDYFNNKNYYATDSLIRIIRSKYDHPSILNRCSILQANILVENRENLEEALTLYRNTPLRFHRLSGYGFRAIAFELLSQKDSADYWFSEGYAQCQDHADSATLDFMKSRIEMMRKDYENAFRLINNAAAVQDSLTRTLLNQSVSIAQRDYYESVMGLQEEKIRSMRERVFLGAILILLVLFLLIMTAINLSRKKDRLLQEQMARLALEERELERANRDNAHLVGSLFSEKIDHFDKLSESYFRMEDGRQKEDLFKEIKHLASTIRNDVALFHSLEKDLDRYCNGVMSKLRTQVPRIKGDNYRIITLFFAGFSYETVQFILNKVSVESLKTARSRFRKEIKNAGAPDMDLFLMMLEMKKRPQADSNENLREC